jgi:hypothetical protein
MVRRRRKYNFALALPRTGYAKKLCAPLRCTLRPLRLKVLPPQGARSTPQSTAEYFLHNANASEGSTDIICIKPAIAPLNLPSGNRCDIIGGYFCNTSTLIHT